jgi:hypothetical protein
VPRELPNAAMLMNLKKLQEFALVMVVRHPTVVYQIAESVPAEVVTLPVTLKPDMEPQVLVVQDDVDA